jgi:mannitol operon repressor
MAKRPILSEALLRTDTQALLDVLNNEPDFSVVIVTLGYLDACLGTLLHNFFIESSVSDNLLEAGRGQLGSFGARSDLAYSLGLISKPMHQDLLQLAQIRNLVAHHHLSMDFSSPTLQDACMKLRYLSIIKNGDLDEPAFRPETMPPPKERFKFTALVLIDQVLLTSKAVERRSLF